LEGERGKGQEEEGNKGASTWELLVLWRSGGSGEIVGELKCGKFGGRGQP
jgi:hypothetical protein